MGKDYFTIAIRNLKSRSLRSWLTVLGIIIGVFLVVFLLSLSQGIKEAILSQLSMMGSDVLMIYPGAGTNLLDTFAGGLELSDDDIRVIQRTSGVEEVIPENWNGMVARFNGEKKTVLVFGIPFEEASEVLVSKLGMQTREGRFPRTDKRELIIGSLIERDTFPGIKIGDRVYINGKQFETVGILKSLGNKHDDSMVGIDLNVFKSITGKRKGAPFVMATIKSGYNQNDVAKRIEQRLKETGERKRGEDSPEVSVITSEKATDMVGNVLSIIQTAIFAIAAFAILVGAVGIMNTMYTSVKERTKEIGIMKAIGARNSDISILFLIESGIIGLIGGVGGTILGIGGAKLVEVSMKMSSTIYIHAHISIVLILGGLLITAMVGCFSGFFPARRASQLKPVDALRSE